MKGFIMPRVVAAGLTSFFRARSVERMRRRADRNDALREPLHGGDETSSFWIVYAR